MSWKSSARRMLSKAMWPIIRPEVEAYVAKMIPPKSYEVCFLSKADVAKKLHLSERQIDRLEEAGEIPRRRRVGSRQVRWLKHEVEECLLSKPVIDLEEQKGSRKRRRRKSGKTRRSRARPEGARHEGGPTSEIGKRKESS